MGGRRRSSANKPQPKKRPRLEKVFKCPKCFHEESTFVDMCVGAGGAGAR